MVAGIVKRWAGRGLERSQIDKTLIPFVSSFFYYLVLAFVVIAVLGIFGIPTASFIAVVGAAGLAIGLALQGTLANFSSGVMLLVFRPFRVGDYVDAGGTAGSVVSIGVFSTTLNTPDNVRIVVPNSSVYGQTIKNYSANDTRRNDLVVGVAYNDDLGRAIETIKSVVTSDPRVLKEPAPVVAVSELADSSVNLVVRPWCSKEDYWGLRFDLTRKLKEELERAGCSIPFPQSDVHIFKTDNVA
jgi:small conductance mechanosensitive channel